jgi:hypothetical protein
MQWDMQDGENDLAEKEGRTKRKCSVLFAPLFSPASGGVSPV